VKHVRKAISNGMKTSLKIACVYLLLHGQPAAADGIGGWPLLRWGMSKQQVEQTYPHFETYNRLLPSMNGDHWLNVFGLPTYVVSGCTFSMDLEFLDNRLERIQLEASFKRGGREDNSCRSIKDSLSEKYGQPKANDAIPGSHALVWTAGETEVTLLNMDFSFQGTDYRWISVMYMDKLRWMPSRGW